jgi:hypothetical protein
MGYRAGLRWPAVEEQRVRLAAAGVEIPRAAAEGCVHRTAPAAVSAPSCRAAVAARAWRLTLKGWSRARIAQRY